MKTCQHCSIQLSRTTKGNNCKKCHIHYFLVPLNKSRIGKKIPPETIKRRADSQRGDKSVNWKGDKVSYAQLHQWVRKYLPAPNLCDNCKQVPPYDLANKGVYNRDFSNWEYLCRRCHIVGDGRVERLQIARDKFNAVTINNVSHPPSKWARILGISINTVYNRVFVQGMSYHDALTKPVSLIRKRKRGD